MESLSTKASGFAISMRVPGAPKSTVIICRDSAHRLICEKLLKLPQVKGWEEIFLRTIARQSKLSLPQKRKLEAICDRHLRKCPNCNGWVMTDILFCCLGGGENG
ncbi:hypothetical protein NIES2119_22065 [[Phormidium ambiguum] IAM M-71]|uniref:Uncharacterized protein n=1 Tax=[Phormidium ambiguum] IAM M-71 TaxID=454136 RepID=A0A1U7IB10_9CYAN|nr:hypothetical protein [Phormidium ambiguum]OKH33798.1 hypothetical protein NIES2119_22065 [Phormidium ambiguum IAM M-71]